MSIPGDQAGWAVLLSEALSALPGCFPRGALAYLTATSKVENPVRDAVSFYVHQRVQSAGYTVAREWIDRRDLAVIDPTGVSVVELEAKALYGFDLLSDRLRAGYLTGLKFGHAKDVTGLRQAATRGCACFLLSLVTHPMARVPPELFAVIKYARDHNARLAREASPLAML